jgi:hypothetical protein
MLRYCFGLVNFGYQKCEVFIILGVIGRDDLPNLGAYVLAHLDVGVGGEVVFEKDGVVVEMTFFVLFYQSMDLLLL